MSAILRTVGIDISKDWLDAFAAPEGRTSRFSNDGAGFRKLIVWVGSEVERIAYEPSGAFHRDLEDTLLKAGLPLYAINPFQVRSFARSLGRRAKSDAVDARMLATMADAVEDLRPTEAKSEGQRDLAELQQVRDALRKDRTATLNRGKNLRTPVGKRLTKQRLRQIDRQLKLIDAEIRRRLEEEKTFGAPGRDPDLDPRHPGHHRRGTDRPDARVGHPHRCPCRQPCRTRSDHPGVRTLEGTQLHPRQQAPGPQAALHARAGRGPAQSRPEAEVRGARRQGESPRASASGTTGARSTGRGRSRRRSSGSASAPRPRTWGSPSATASRSGSSKR